jgi:hypothetical protein
MHSRVWLFGALFLLSLFHPHLAEKWRWVGEVVRHGVSWSERFRPIDSFDLVLHTALTVGLLVAAVAAFRSGG